MAMLHADMKVSYYTKFINSIINKNEESMFLLQEVLLSMVVK